MFHFCLFAGTEGEMPPAGMTAITIFGGSELRRPTLAREIGAWRARRGMPRSRWRWLFGSDENLIVTIFGATCVVEPTLVEEYAAMASLVRSGQVTGEELPSLLDGLESQIGGRDSYRTLTLFGGCVVRRRSPSRERKALDAAVANGGLDHRTRSWLETLVEAPRGVRWRALGELVANPLRAPAGA
ncbi:MAG: hypothetical protein IT457_23760 [Planctomycetes bacterium]|nr:hypothetical protein [Planctomycetota bacterium]